MLEWDRELVINEIKKDVGHFLVRGSNRKIVNLAFEDNTLVDGAGVQTGFLNMELDGKIMPLDLQLQMDACVESDFPVIDKSLSKWESRMAVKRVELS